MFELFTDSARRVILHAKEEAEKLLQPYIDSEHLLLGLLREKSGVVSQIFTRKNISAQKVIADIRLNVGEGGIFIFKGNLPFSASAKKSLDYSIEESKRMGNRYVGVEHILLGILKESRSQASLTLSRFGFELDTLREEIIALSTNNPSDTSSQTPLLEEFGRDLTALAKQNKLDVLIGRDSEIARLVQTLSRRQKNNAILLGESGVGKTAIVEGLAKRLLDEDIPEYLRKKRIYSVDLGTLVAGTKYRGQFEERVKNLIKEVEADKNIIIFIDEIHTIVGAGAAEGSIDAANMLKPALARGSVQCIGATTISEYRKNIEKDAALERRFQSIIINQPNKEETVSILRGVKKHYENFHKVFIPDEVIEEIITLTDRYITSKFQPDKSIDVLDEAASKRKLAHLKMPADICQLKHKLTSVRKERDIFARSSEFELLDKYSKELNKLTKNYQARVALWNEDINSNWPYLDSDDVSEVVAKISGVPNKRIKDGDKERVLKLGEELKKSVIAQDEAVESVTKAIKRSFAGLSNPNRPLGSFIFLGPTGVGKTEVAKKLAEVVFGTGDALIRIDMSEFIERFNVSRLVGAPPGYVGYEEGGKLTEQVRRRPYSVVLFDEVEKAHPEVMNILLQILDEGFITDSLGHKVDFKNTIIILTSNIGTKKGISEKSLGFLNQNDKNGEINYEKFKSAAQKELTEHFQPEFLNRVDNVIFFKPLGVEDLKKIIDLRVAEINSRLQSIGIKIEVDEDTKTLLLSNDYPFIYGARPIKRLLESKIEDKLSDLLLAGKIKHRKNLKTAVVGHEIVIK